MSLWEKPQLPTLLPCHMSPPRPCRDAALALATTQDSSGDGWEPGGRDVHRFTHWAWLRKRAHKDKRKDPKLSLERPGPAPAYPGGEAGTGPAGTECQEHFQTHTARVPPKYRYRRFFTSCVISKPKPSPITTCHEEPNFLSIVSLIILAALCKGEAACQREGETQLELLASGRPAALFLLLCTEPSERASRPGCCTGTGSELGPPRLPVLRATEVAPARRESIGAWGHHHPGRVPAERLLPHRFSGLQGQTDCLSQVW